MIKFWKSSASGFASRKLFKDSSTLANGSFFHSLAYIFGGSDQIFIKILSQMYPWTRKSPLNFGGNPDIRVRIRTPTLDPDQILLGGGMRSLTAAIVRIFVENDV